MKSEFNMFNLDQAITEWRRQMTSAGVKKPAVLDELAAHLREDVAALVSAGESEAHAFELAVSRLGQPGALKPEFRKVAAGTWPPVKIGLWIWVAATIALAALLINGMVTGRLTALLLAHVFSLTAGYFAAFFAGGFGICYVGCRSFRALSPLREQALSQAAVRFTRLAAVLTVAGFVLGMLWTGQNRGGYLTGDPREIGTLGAAVWLVGLCLVQRLHGTGPRAVMLLSIAGNMIIGLAWFGAGTLAHGNSIVSYWPLDALIAVHLIVFIMGVMPFTEPVEA
jgi:hypothetical protein